MRDDLTERVAAFDANLIKAMNVYVLCARRINSIWFCEQLTAIIECVCSGLKLYNVRVAQVCPTSIANCLGEERFTF